MNGSGEQHPAERPPDAELPPEQEPDLRSGQSPEEDTELEFRDLALALAPSDRPGVRPSGLPTDALQEDRVVLPARGIPGRPAFATPTTVATPPQASAPDGSRPKTVAPEAFFVRENFERTRRAIGVLLRDDPTEAEDITQEAFVIVYERWNKVSVMDNPLGYTTTVAWRLALKWLRKRKRERELIAALPPAVADGAADGIIARAGLQSAFLRLGPAHQEMLVLSMSGLVPKDVAPLLGIPVTTARTRLYRARRALLKFLEEPREGQS
ncbi:RNA polymerase sigma factor [Streptomyces sp. NPDC060187]|uniref:RNA polymerase sigma factor n=1 Tax=Streptomyces sp. NPDC060187 TaxID=3347067 RepID=UPI00365F040D